MNKNAMLKVMKKAETFDIKLNVVFYNFKTKIETTEEYNPDELSKLKRTLKRYDEDLEPYRGAKMIKTAYLDIEYLEYLFFKEREGWTVEETQKEYAKKYAKHVTTGTIRNRYIRYGVEYDTEYQKKERIKIERKLKLLEEMQGQNKTLEEIKNEYYKRTGVNWQTWDISETARRYGIELKALTKQKSRAEKKEIKKS